VTLAAFDKICDHLFRDYFCRPNYWRIECKPYFSFFDLGNLLASFGSVPADKCPAEPSVL
jgi:hypothetical protein